MDLFFRFALLALCLSLLAVDVSHSAAAAQAAVAASPGGFSWCPPTVNCSCVTLTTGANNETLLDCRSLSLSSLPSLPTPVNETGIQKL